MSIFPEGLASYASIIGTPLHTFYMSIHTLQTLMIFTVDNGMVC